MTDIQKQTSKPDALAKRFLKLKAKRSEVAKLKKALDAEYDDLRENLLDTTRGLGVLTLKTEDYIIVRAKSKRFKVVDEQKAIESMQKQELTPIMRLDYYGNLPTFKNRKIEGVEETESEYITIKEVIGK